MVLPTADKVAAAESTSGLSAEQAAQRLHQDGPNVLSRDSQRRWLAIVRETLHEPMFMLLLAAGSLYLLLGDLQEELILLVLVLLVLGLTLYQEGKTERAIAALRDMSSPRARVLREGQTLRIASAEVVCGDVLLLAEGDRLAADAVLLHGTEVQVDESLLTGEAVPVHKVARDGPEACLYAGTLLVSGHGAARVTATGARSAMGRISQALSSLSTEPSPLRQQTARLVQMLALGALAASVLLVLAYGLIRGDWLGALLAGIALAMALLPQEFTVVLTVLPALGAWRLAQQRVLTRRLSAIETLGATSVLCVDKTGTLTENRMTVVQLYVQDGGEAPGQHLNIDYANATALPESFHTLAEFSILASVVEPFDPTEQAFHRLGQHFLKDTEHLHHDWALLQVYGLTPQLRAMSHVWRSALGATAHVVAAKGAPEAIVDLCHLGDEARARVESATQAMAAQGLRVLGVAQARFVGHQWPAVAHDFEFQFIGLLGLADPLRAQIAPAVAQCHSAGIRVVMITGDYPATARAIAAQAQLGAPEQPVLTGEVIAHLSEAELQACLQSVNVCARITPEQKLRIVQALQANGAVVAMTGDGVNDAPALKAAHVGVAMGGRGTDVAREAAALVLLDDNFAALVQAVRLGRRIFDNLRKSMSYVVAVHVPIAGVALLPVLLGWPVLLFPLHIAFLELVIDPACSLVFENEPSEHDVMQRPPRDTQAPLLDRPTWLLALLQGLGVLLVVLAAYVWSATWLSDQGARAFTFVTLVSGNLTLIFSSRAGAGALWDSLWVPNRTVWLVSGATLTVLGLALYLPWLARLCFFEPLALLDVLTALLLGSLSVLWFEAVKWQRRRQRSALHS